MLECHSQNQRKDSMSNIQMQLPSSSEGEKAILSSIILNNDIYNEVSEYLFDDVFYDSKNK